MRDALSLLDCCLSYTDGAVSLQLARDVLGSAGRAVMFDFADALADFDSARALTLIDEATRKGSDPQVFARDVAAHLRALMLAGAVGDVSQMLEITPEDAARFREQSAKMDAARTARLMELFMRAEPDMKWASRPRTVLELAAVRACHPEEEADAGLSERLSRMEKMLERGVPAPAVKPAAQQSAAPATQQKPKPQPVPAGPRATPPKEYLDALEKIGEALPSIRSTLPSMLFVSYENDVVTAEFSKKTMMHMRLLERKKEQLEQILSDAFGRPTALSMVVQGDSAAPKSASNATAKKVIEQSYDIFGRENIDLI